MSLITVDNFKSANIRMPHNHLNEIALGISALNVPFVKRDT